MGQKLLQGSAAPDRAAGCRRTGEAREMQRKILNVLEAVARKGGVSMVITARPVIKIAAEIPHAMVQRRICRGYDSGCRKARPCPIPGADLPGGKGAQRACCTFGEALHFVKQQCSLAGRRRLPCSAPFASREGAPDVPDVSIKSASSSAPQFIV